MAADSTATIAIMAKELAEATAPSKLTEILTALGKETVTKDCLKTTGIGKKVNELRKHEDETVQGLARGLVREWKKLVKSSASSSKKSSVPATPPTPSSTMFNSPTPSKADNGFPETNGNGASGSSEAAAVASESPAAPAGSSAASASKSSSTAPPSQSDLPASGSPIRDMIRKFVFQGLILAHLDESCLDVIELVVAIEEELFGKYKNAAEYKRQASMYARCLKKDTNAVLRQQLVSGADLASQAVKQSIVAAKKESDKQLVPETGGSASTDMFKCGTCGKRETTYYQMQTRSADEPMTTFVTCVPCGAKWRFC